MFLLTIRKVYQRVASNWGRVNGFSSCSVSYVHTRQVFSMVPFNPDILLSVWLILHSYVFVLLSHGIGKTGNVLFVMQSFEIYLKCLDTDSICFLYRT